MMSSKFMKSSSNLVATLRVGDRQPEQENRKCEKHQIQHRHLLLELQDNVQGRRKLRAVGLIVVRPRVRRPVQANFGSEAQARVELAGRAQGRLEKGGRETRASEHRRARSFFIPKPLDPRSQPQPRADRTKKVYRVA